MEAHERAFEVAVVAHSVRVDMRAHLASLGKRVGARVSAVLHAMFGSRRHSGFGILMFHRVTEPQPGIPGPTWNVPPARFRAQMEGLLTRGYRVVSLRTVLEHARDGRGLPAKTTVLTFDDGYQSAYWRVWPILRELKIPATVFVTTAFVDSAMPFPFDRWGATHYRRATAEAWQPLTWAQCRELEQSGLVEIGSHSHTHRDFREKAEELGRDLAASLSDLRERLGRDGFTFSFPYGGKDLGFAGEEQMRAARQSGFICALTTETESSVPTNSPFGWGRYEVVESDTAATIAAKLDGWYDWTARARDIFRLFLPPRPTRIAPSDSTIAS
jgi:peptidoglycan/xylan/chitin deacetylase (PgdA/CDA1 family)